MLQGLMMRSPLLISSLITHADRHHGDVEIVSRRVEGDIHRTTYRDCTDAHGRSPTHWTGSACAPATASRPWLERLSPLELYFAVSGRGCGAAHGQPAPASGADRLDRQPRRRPRALLRRHASCR